VLPRVGRRPKQSNDPFGLVPALSLEEAFDLFFIRKVEKYLSLRIVVGIVGSD